MSCPKELLKKRPKDPVRWSFTMVNKIYFGTNHEVCVSPCFQRRLFTFAVDYCTERPAWLTVYLIIPTFNYPATKAFWKQCGERRKCWFPHIVFYPSKPNFNFLFTFILLSAIAFNLDQSKILLLVKDLTVVSNHLFQLDFRSNKARGNLINCVLFICFAISKTEKDYKKALF